MAVNDDYNTYLKEVINTLTEADSFIDKQDKSLENWFNKYGFTNEQIAQVMGQSLTARIQFIPQMASNAALEMIKEQRARDLTNKEIEKINKQIELINAQIDKEIEQKNLVLAQQKLIDRQEKGYNDNLLVKAGEFEGGLASFAVNAGSASAQDAIDNFVSTVKDIKARIPNDSAPDIVVGTITSTTIELDWYPVENATLYKVYLDGEVYSEQTAADKIITGLTTATTYTIVVTSFINGVESSTKNSVEVTTA